MKSLFNHLGKRSFHFKIILPAFLVFILFLTSIFSIIIPRFEEIIVGRKREMIRELTNSAWSILDGNYKKEIKGELKRSEARKAAIEQIENLKYGEERKDYFWITDFTPVMIIHPYRKDLNGTDLNSFADPKGKKLFVEMVNLVKEKKEGYLDYMWQWKDDSTRIVPKLSFVKEFEPWGWVIGTGIYIQDVKEEIAALEKNVLSISILIAAGVSFLLTFITIQNIRSERKRKEAENEVREAKEKYKALVEASTEGLVMILPGKQFFYNKTFLSMLGFDENEQNGLKLESIFRDLKVKWDEPALTHEGENIFPVDTRAFKKEGDFIDVHLQKAEIDMPGNKGFILIVKDISFHKAIENELGESIEKYNTLASQLSMGVFRASQKDKKFAQVNNAMVSILGAQNEQQLFSYSLFDFFENPQEGKLIQDLLAENRVVKDRIINLRKLNGDKAIVSVSVAPIANGQNRGADFDGIIEDVTLSRKTDEEKENLIKEMQSSILFLNKPVRTYSVEPVTAEMETPAGAVLEKMAFRGIDAAIVKTDRNNSIGIITHSDILNRIVLEKKSITTPVCQVMSSPVISVNADATVYNALIKMHRSKVNKLAVVNEKEEITGIIRKKDLIKDSHQEYLTFLRGIGESHSVDEIANYYNRLSHLLRSLIESGAGVRLVSAMNSAISDSITKSLIDLYIYDKGAPPAKFAFMVMGSGGREEPTLVTDQDNALIFEDVPENRLDEVTGYFSQMSEFLCNSLKKIGYAYCTGNVMAKNPKWCQPLSLWKKYFTDWINCADPKSLLDVNIFFDFRFVYGTDTLTVELKNHLKKITSMNNTFFIYLAQNAANITPPETQFKGGKPFDIKLLLLPIVDILRLLSLKHQSPFNNSFERLEYLYEKNIIPPGRYREMAHIYSFLLQMRFQHQSKMLAENLTPDNIINPKLLSEFELSSLKQVFSRIEELKTSLTADSKSVF